MASVGEGRSVRDIGTINRPGSPIPTGSCDQLKVDQLGIFQSGASFEKSLDEEISERLARTVSYFENDNASLQVAAGMHKSTPLSNVQDDLFVSGDDPQERDETRSLSFHVRSMRPASSFKNMFECKSFKGPSFSFSSGGKVSSSRSSLVSTLPRYSKTQGSFYDQSTANSTTSDAKFAKVFENADEDDDDDGSLKSSLDDESDSDESVPSSISGEFELYRQVEDVPSGPDGFL
ncbi:hypothetical protein NDN08_008281 [Rhodosorus marinus]|uniref:Uncharacterized protein n=1 Tax=Rhodosorus marinus TaxID=101924 RepID=A0AAV8V429_9RHOD|nr:hypothetical protein NDN08_008281 [Rhodosorus marinus]